MPEIVHNELNLITVGLVLILALAVGWFGWKVWDWMHKELVRLRAELPRAVIGELLTRMEFTKLTETVHDTRAKLEYVKTRLDAHIADEHTHSDE